MDRKLIQQRYREKNKELLKQKNKEYKEKNKERDKSKKAEYDKKYRETNKDKIAEIKKNHYETNKEKRREYFREYKKKRKENDNLYFLKEKYRNILYKAIRYKTSKTGSSESILGCTYDEFKLHLESKFESWMNWGNYGLYNGTAKYGWDIDHIIPLTKAINEEILLKLNNFTNLQPLCSYINRDIKKGR